MTETARSRFNAALRGTPASPLVAGLTFASPDVLSALTPGCDVVAERLLSAARALSLDFVFVAASAPWAEEVCANRGDLAVVWVVDGPLWPVLASSGSVAEALKRTLRDPSSLAEALDREIARATMRVARGLELRVDAVVVADDLAGSEGLLVTPEFAHGEVLPRMARLASLALGRAPVLLHSDGDIRALLTALHAAGFAGVHSGGLSREDFEGLFWEARRLGLSVLGGIPASALGRGSYAAIQAGTRVALLAQAGGLLIADDGGITTSEQMEAFAAAIGAARGGIATSPREH